MSWHLINTLYWLKLCVPCIINKRRNTTFIYHLWPFIALIYYCDISERKKLQNKSGKNKWSISVLKKSCFLCNVTWHLSKHYLFLFWVGFHTTNASDLLFINWTLFLFTLYQNRPCCTRTVKHKPKWISYFIITLICFGHPLSLRWKVISLCPFAVWSLYGLSFLHI